MIDLLQIVASIGGVGAVFGIVVFFIYRIDRKASEKRLSKLLEQDQETRREHTKAVVEYTKAVTELTILLTRMNGKSK